MEADKDTIDLFTLNIPYVQHSKSHVQGQTHRRIGEGRREAPVIKCC